jgi:4-hydroxymandelate oxidase
MLAQLREYAEAFHDAVPAEIADYIDGGSGAEATLGAASAAWLQWTLLPRVLRDVSTIDTRTTVLGADLAAPLGVAPTGFHTLAHPDGELATAAGAAGALFVVSARATQRYADIAAAAAGPWWAQLYVMRERAVTAGAAQQAAAAGAGALVLTGDTPYVGRKARQGRPVSLASDGTLLNFRDHLPAGADPAVATEQDPAATLDAVRWLTDLTGLPVLVKGVLRADDARACVAAGAAGIVVSNHGGRQLDRAAATATVLPEVAAAVGEQVPVLVDGGIRSGLDVLTALALGATAVLIGRPVLWALATDGAAGVAGVFAALSDDLRHVLGLVGAASPADLDRSMVRRG